jgi:serine protease
MHGSYYSIGARVRRSAMALALVTGSLALGAVSTAHASHPTDQGQGELNPGHGKVEHRTRDNKAPQPATSSGAGQLKYQGGVNGIGVTTGSPKVYLVFWGAGWGTAGSNGTDVTLSGDARGVAPLLQRFFRGLGTNNELWSGVMTQYCEGVAVGTVTCPNASAHVGYPTGGALAGVWVDPSTTAITSSGSTATSPVDHDIAAEAVLAAAHFGNTTATSNRSVQYVILSPTGTHPGGFNTRNANWCAWHDYNGDSTLVGGAAASAYGDIAFTNMPYVTDMGTSCGANYVNAGTAGVADGVTIVEGHEYAETITDQNPAGGWIDTTGYENADKCSWVGVGGTGGAQNITLATGTFAIQGTWSNDGAAGAGSCAVAHAIVKPLTNDFALSAVPASLTLATGAAGTSTVSTSVTLGAPGTVALSVSGTPAGTSAILGATSVAAGAATTLTVTNTSAAAGAYTLTVTGTAAGVTHTATVTLVVPGVTNGGFESSLTGWTPAGTAAAVTSPVHGGTRSVLTGSTTSPTNGDSSVTQTFVAKGATLTFWYRVRCAETISADWATATLLDNTAASTTTPLPRTCTNTSTWVQVSVPVVAGHSYTLKLINHDNNLNRTSKNTYTMFDDVVG